jgi:hypothetical protein
VDFSNTPIPITALISGAIGFVLWTVGVLILRHRNFPNGTRKTGLRGDRSDEINQHNDAIYQDFEFFYKLTLAIVGGLFFLTTRNAALKTDVVDLVVQMAQLLQIVSGILFSLFIFLHQKSKIERWDKRYSFLEILTWQESWMIVAMLAVSGAVAFGLAPALAYARPQPG